MKYLLIASVLLYTAYVSNNYITWHTTTALCMFFLEILGNNDSAKRDDCSFQTQISIAKKKQLYLGKLLSQINPDS